MTFNFEVFSAIITSLLALSEMLPIVSKGRVKGIVHGLYTMQYNCGCLKGELKTETNLDVDQDLEAQKKDAEGANV